MRPGAKVGMMTDRPRPVGELAAILDGRKALLCDVWGVVHNGVDHMPAAARALAGARERGVAVVLITNAPRPAADVIVQLDRFGLPHSAYDRVVTSGDVTRDLIAEGPRRLYHLGPERDFGIFAGLALALVVFFIVIKNTIVAYNDIPNGRSTMGAVAMQAGVGVLLMVFIMFLLTEAAEIL